MLWGMLISFKVLQPLRLLKIVESNRLGISQDIFGLASLNVVHIVPSDPDLSPDSHLRPGPARSTNLRGDAHAPDQFIDRGQVGHIGVCNSQVEVANPCSGGIDVAGCVSFRIEEPAQEVGSEVLQIPHQNPDVPANGHPANCIQFACKSGTGLSSDRLGRRLRNEDEDFEETSNFDGGCRWNSDSSSADSGRRLLLLREQHLHFTQGHKHHIDHYHHYIHHIVSVVIAGILRSDCEQRISRALSGERDGVHAVHVWRRQAWERREYMHWDLCSRLATILRQRPESPLRSELV